MPQTFVYLLYIYKLFKRYLMEYPCGLNKLKKCLNIFVFAFLFLICSFSANSYFSIAPSMLLKHGLS